MRISDWSSDVCSSDLEVVRTLHVVRALDLVVDVLDARARGREQRNLVVDLVDAQQGRIADAVADACVADGGPEALVAHGVGGAQANVAEAGAAGVAAAVPATAGPRQIGRASCRESVCQYG